MSYRNVLIWFPKIREDLLLNNAWRSRRAIETKLRQDLTVNEMIKRTCKKAKIK